jgi:hypothetical protein
MYERRSPLFLRSRRMHPAAKTPARQRAARIRASPREKGRKPVSLPRDPTSRGFAFSLQKREKPGRARDRALRIPPAPRKRREARARPFGI